MKTLKIIGHFKNIFSLMAGLRPVYRESLYMSSQMREFKWFYLHNFALNFLAVAIMNHDSGS